MAVLLRCCCCCLYESWTRWIVLSGSLSVWNEEHRASWVVLVFFRYWQRRARWDLCIDILVVRDVQVEQRRFLIVAPAKVKRRLVDRWPRKVELWHWLVSLYCSDGCFARTGESWDAILGRLARMMGRGSTSKRPGRCRRRECRIKRPRKGLRGYAVVLGGCPGASTQGG